MIELTGFVVVVTSQTMIKHVCIFPDRIDDGGIDRYALNLGQALLNEGLKIDFFVTTGTGKLLSQRPKDTRLFVGGGTTRTSIWPFYKYLVKNRPDVVISANLYIDIICIITRILSRTHTRNLVSLHTAFSKDDYRGKAKHKAVFAQICRFLYPRTHHIVAVSDAVATDATRYFRLRNEVKVIYNPVVSSDLKRLSKMKISHRFYDQKTHPVILAIGRLTAQKDFETLLRAFAKLTSTTPARLVILGDGEDRLKLQELAVTLGIDQKIDLAGFVENPYPYIANAAVLVSSSRWEGLPTVIIEALALGTKVVATDCLGGSREILDDGYFGALVPEQNPHRLAQAIVTAIATEVNVEELKARGDSFSFTTCAQKYLALMNS
jgi:glycosyltransferase involved in cell wall biosynthesis